MAVPAADVAAELRRRLGDLPTKKLHKLLYYCQGHHLAATDHQLFSETISAWDMGPVVGSLWYDERDRGLSDKSGRLDEGALNTIGYVISRYGRLTGRDLEHLTHAETPWLRANHDRRPGESSRIEAIWMKEYFAAEATSDDDPMFDLDSGAVSDWLAAAQTRRHDQLHTDSYEELRARLADAR
jgi:uncharacterized phage-associated protein